MSLVFDGFVSEPVSLHRGINQGCPLSGILFQFYNADLIDGYDPKKGETAVTFVDDALMIAHVKTLLEANTKLVDKMTHPGGGLDWSCTHHCDFAIDNFVIMRLTRKREPSPSGRLPTRPVHRHPITLRGVEIPMVMAHKFLGVLIDQDLQWKEQVNYTLQKGTKWVAQYHRLAKPTRGVSAKYMRQFYITVAVLKVLYAANLFLITENRNSKGKKGYINKLGQVQRQAGLHITGAMRSAPTDAVNACADLLLFHLLVEKVIHRASTWLTMLPSSHPLAKHVEKAAGKFIKWHRAPVHEVMHTFDIWPADFEKIKPVRCDLKWEPGLKMCIAGSRGAAVEEVTAV